MYIDIYLYIYIHRLGFRRLGLGAATSPRQVLLTEVGHGHSKLRSIACKLRAPAERSATGC